MMTPRKQTETQDLLRKGLLIVARGLLGVGLALVLSISALAVAWGLYLFSGASSRETFLIMSMLGAGIGSGIGAYIPWIKLDRQQRTATALVLVLVLAAGVGGGLIGYDYGANREIECCAEPHTTPFLYTAFGAAILANLVMFLISSSGAATRLLRSGRRVMQG